MSHLLIVDDEPSICWGLAELAESLGHSVATAASAEQGLEAAAARRPDVIVLDVRLPGMSGLAAMDHFRRAAGPVPIIIITAFGDLATAVEAVRNGAFEYLLKPFDLAAAQRAIQRGSGQPLSTAGDGRLSARNRARDPIVGPFGRDPRGVQTHCPGGPFRRLRSPARRKRHGQGAWRPAPFIATAGVPPGRSWRSTWPR